MLLEKPVTSEGFFQAHHKNVRQALSDVILKNFTNIEDSEKRVAFLENIPEIKSFIDSLKILNEDSRKSTISGRKDHDTAKTLKYEGNRFVQKGDWKMAHNLYTKSALAMPYDKAAELSVVFANRSATLYHLQEYEACLADIEMALSLGYPKELKYKVLDRKARCYLALKWNVEARSAFQETVSSLDGTIIQNAKLQKLQIDAQVMIEILNKSLQMLGSKSGRHRERSDPDFLPEVSRRSNKTYAAASEAISIERNDSEGRFAQSTRSVYAGEIVVVEKAHCSVLLAEYANTHCFQCFKRCVNPVPCRTCSNVIFCSERCHTSAYETYHKYECPVLRLIWDSGCSITCHMALRIIMQRPLSYFKDLKSKLKEPQTGKYQSDDYRCVYNLVGHENQRSKADLFQRTHMATFLLSLLKKTNYFHVTKVKDSTSKPNDNNKSVNDNQESVNDNQESVNDNQGSVNDNQASVNDNQESVNDNQESVNDNQASVNDNQESVNDNQEPESSNTEYEVDIESGPYIGSLILKNLQILQFNAHEIFELQCTRPADKKTKLRKDQGKTAFLGGGLYPTLALFNHSCEPGVTRFFKGTSVVVQMVKNVKKGQQICENYGPLSTRKSYEERQAELKDQYWFECRCIACEQKWPKFEDMNETYMRFKCDSNSKNTCTNVIPVASNCTDFMVLCGLCHKQTNIMKGLKALQNTVNAQKYGKEHMEKGEYGKALVKFIEELRLYDDTLAPPFKDYHLCQQNIRRCLLTFGNVTID